MWAPRLAGALLLGALFLAAGTSGAFAFCNSTIETYAIFQCGQRGYFAPVPAPHSPASVTGIFWQLGFGNESINTGLGSDGTGVESSTFNGNDSGMWPVNFLDADAVFPAEGFPAGSICLGSNNWANSGVDGCCDNPRPATPFSYTNYYSGLGPYTYPNDDDILNPYFGTFQADRGYLGYYSLASVMDYPVAILARTPGDTYFAIAAVTNMSRGNNGVTTPSDCFSGFPANPATCDGRQGEWRFGDVINGLPNAILSQDGRTNVIPWQQPPVPQAGGVTPADPNDPNSSSVVDLTWSAVTLFHDGRSVPTNNPTLDARNPGQPGDPNAAPGVGVPDILERFGLVRYQLQVADFADTGFTTLSQSVMCPGDPACTSATSATLTLGVSECVRIRTHFGTPQREAVFSTAACRLGKCGDIGYGVSGTRLCVGQCEPDPNGETCNGLDDDCDSLVDEDFLIGESCDGVGECGAGVYECSGAGSAICSTDPGGSDYVFVMEQCNGLDDDCDASTDETFLIAQACDGIGQCGVGVIECSGPGATVCSTNPGGSDNQSSAEVCDGLDNDCDGSTDEALAPTPSTCGVGSCASTGELTCLSGQPVDSCTPGTPSPEICDDLDNDCDGTVDEGTSECGVGECQRSATCVDGVSTCLPGPPAPESCDSLDNDCDGATDETFNLGAPCDGIGECGAGVVECNITLGTSCSTDPGTRGDQSSPELCDTLDNDCDGSIDEDFNLGALCEGAGECGSGVIECAAPIQYLACGNGSGLTAAHTANGVLCEDFDTDRNASGRPGDFSRLPAAISPSDPLLALGDPNDDVLGYTVNGGAPPGGVNGQICSTDLGSTTGGTCHPVPSENDWHLHSAFEGCDDTGNAASLNSYDLGNPAFSSRCAPDERAHSGFRSLHMGRHLNATDTTRDTYRFRQTSAFVMDPVILGTTSLLQFWQAISVIDYRAGISTGTTTAGGQVQMSLFDPGTGLYQPWRRLAASQNSYAVVDQEAFTICEFDPGDDGGAPLNETMCGGQPQWSHMGDIYGSNLGCLVDSDTGFEANGDCGDTGNRTVNAGCQWVADPSCGSFLENGGEGTGLGRGSGVWARTTFNLGSFSGRKARFRWIFEGGGGWQFGESRSWLEPEPGGAPYQGYQMDDGWYIDDIKLSGLATGVLAPICSTESGGSEDRSQPELCDLLDNDCDGVTDGFNPTCGVGACVQTGSCSAGVETCTPGAPSTEACDLVDNDCDGTTDESSTTTCGVGACLRSGTCTAGIPFCTPGAPSPEICDNIDNNCDGIIDSIVTGCGIGACRRTGSCVAGVSNCVPAAPSPEICDGLDNDCDGATDELGTTCGVGACMRSGSCAGGVGTCTPGAPSAEICDNVDNDCDGTTDEVGATCGVGACMRAGSCADGVPTCTPGAPSAEICDNLDNDCDGTTDGFGTTCGVGACLRSGSCASGVDTCTPGAPSSETCDGLDNDCDASTDEGFLLGQPCDGVGACGAGVFECLGPAASVCSTDPGGSGDQSALEICDNLDNDCDGTTDSFPTSCGLSQCAATGSCASGVDTCTPLPPSAADDSLCNGIDDDCDGGTDEEFVPAPTVCGIGTCVSAGANACQGGAIVDTCMPGAPSAEICDNLDNNCDGTTDSFGTQCGLGACARTGSCSAGIDSCSPGQPTSETCDLLDHDCDGIPANPTKSDRDQDGVDDGCDNCPNDFNPGQQDSDGDGIGNACEPLLVRLSYFKGEIIKGRVVLTWATASETDSAGFNVYRSTSPSGPWEKRNAAMIPSQGSESTGAVYTLSERRPPRARVLYYILEDLDLSGAATRHPAIEVVVRKTQGAP